MAEIATLIERAKYYERLTRQYNELSDFLQALETKEDTFSVYPASQYLPIKHTNFRDIEISTPALIKGKDSVTKKNYSALLIQDLGMDKAAEYITDFLIGVVKTSMRAIEDELALVFNGIEVRNE